MNSCPRKGSARCDRASHLASGTASICCDLRCFSLSLSLALSLRSPLCPHAHATCPPLLACIRHSTARTDTHRHTWPDCAMSTAMSFMMACCTAWPSSDTRGMAAKSHPNRAKHSVQRGTQLGLRTKMQRKRNRLFSAQAMQRYAQQSQGRKVKCVHIVHPCQTARATQGLTVVLG